MHESKSFASLGPTLLARKGAAKPAMRPQFGPVPTLAAPTAEDNDDDLEWDVEAEREVHEAVAQVFAERPVRSANGHGAISGQPEVRRQIEAIAAHVARKEATVEAPPPAPRDEVPAPAREHRAAFTLRLDSQRHLKLRLACTIRNRSAQQIVTEALDHLLNAMPEVDSLAAQLRRAD